MKDVAGFGERPGNSSRRWEQVVHEADGISNPPDEYSVLGALTTFTEHNFSILIVEGMLLLDGAVALGV
jgi:hypothetical protein